MVSIDFSETNSYDDAAKEYDALLIVSFGGPEKMADVLPYLERVLAGKRVPQERLLEVAHHYEMFDGISPINEQNRKLIAALRNELDASGIELPIYWGNRNWHPLLLNTLQQMVNDGVERVLAFFTAAYSSYSSCRQYWEDIEAACAEIGSAAPKLDKIRFFYNHPDFIEANADHLRTALKTLPTQRQKSTKLFFTAHSIPLAMAANSDYVQQIEETCRLVADAVECDDWQLVYQSRSGSPHQAWLEPDICDVLTETCDANPDLQDVVIMPIGFISDHMEVLYDLDTEAKAILDKQGVNLVRVPTVGVHPHFITMIRKLIVERIIDNPERPAIGHFYASHDICGKSCCLKG